MRFRCVCPPRRKPRPRNLRRSLQSLLQAHPEVADQLKAILARQLQGEGSAIEPQAISDTMLAAKFESDAKFRTTAIHDLVEQGTITEAEGQSILKGFGDSNQQTSVSADEISQAGAAGSAEPTNNSGEQTGNSSGRTSSSTGLMRGGARSGEPSATIAPGRTAASDQKFDDSSINPRTIPQPNPYPNLASTKRCTRNFLRTPRR